MTTASADDPMHSMIGANHTLALEIILLKRTYVLQWSQFLYAEGGNDEVRLTFSTHDVLIKGSNLNLLISTIAANGIAQLQEPARPDRLYAGTGTFIREISVEKIEEERQ
jgi:hypothetical protein